MDFKAVGSRIKTARENAGLTQEELAKKLHLSPNHISCIERGVKAPKLETFVTIANAIGVSSGLLLQDVLEADEHRRDSGIILAVNALSHED